MKIDIYHNIRWSRYKARVFSALHRRANIEQIDIRFFQIADTSSQRADLSGVNLEFHQYPHELLFPGSYNAIQKTTLIKKLFWRVMNSDAELVLIPGYDRVEHWCMLLACIISGKMRGVFCDSTLNDKRQSLVKGLFKRIFFGFCNGIFGYGTRSQELLIYYGVPLSRIFQPCQAAALSDNYTLETARESRLRLAPIPTNPRLLYVGRLSTEKCIDVLLRAFAKLLKAIPSAQLVIIGSGPQADALKALATDLSVGNLVVFTGAMDQASIADQYSSSTCLVLPSRSEPWGLVVNEALHYGCPVVVSDNCGCVPELVQEGITGFSFKTFDEDDLCNKMKKLISEFDDVNMTTNHCLKTIAQFTPDKAAENVLRGCKMIVSKAT